MQYFKFFFSSLVAILFIAASGCAVNRVQYVNNAKDAQSFYKIPVIYGTCDLKDEQDIRLSGWLHYAFGEFNSQTQKGTGGCLGSNDYFPLSLSQNGCEDKKAQYHVVMVPPDEYVSLILKFQDDKKHHSAYFKAEGNTPIYLGNFNAQMAQDNNKYHYMPVSLIRYDMDRARAILEGFDINASKMRKAEFFPTNGSKSIFLCTP